MAALEGEWPAREGVDAETVLLGGNRGFPSEGFLGMTT